MPTYDEAPRPRVLLFVGPRCPDTPEIEERIRKLVGTLERHDINPSNISADVRWESYEAVIALGCAQIYVDDSVRVLQVGGFPVGARSGPVGVMTSIQRRKSKGPELQVADDLPQGDKEIAKLLLPLLRDEPLPRTSWDVGSWAWDKETSWDRPLVADLDSNSYAMTYRPDVGPVEVAYLPDLALTDPAILEAAVVWALSKWSANDPVHFPGLPDWRLERAWLTPSEIDATAQVSDARAELDSAMAQLQAKVSAAEAHLAEERSRADAGIRRLLTETGDPLVDATISALQLLGFAVSDSDAHPDRRERREDLIVTDENWTTVVEVKGYNKGGSTSDLLKLGRWVELFIKSTGEPPDARWYVCNQFRGRHPNSRQILLRGQDADIEVLAENSGLAIDTRDLFRLSRDVENGTIDRGAARNLLKSSLGRFSYPVE